MTDTKRFLQIIKKAAMEAFQASHPCDFLFGRVTGTSPLQVTVGGIELSGSLLCVNSSCPELNEKDPVLLGRKAGGQMFIVLGKVEHR